MVRIPGAGIFTVATYECESYIRLHTLEKKIVAFELNPIERLANTMGQEGAKRAYYKN